jgi:hypothetical protein
MPTNVYDSSVVAGQWQSATNKLVRHWPPDEMSAPPPDDAAA